MRRIARTVLAAACLSALAVTAGCGEDDVKPATDDGQVKKVDDEDDQTTEAAGEDTELPSEEDLERYFTAITTYDVDALESAMDLAEPGSIAEAYAGYILASANAAIDGGSPYEGQEPDKVDGGFKVCNDGCTTWADVQGRDGKIVTFTVNGESLDDRLSAGNGKVIKAGSLGSAELLYAYKSVQSDAVFVLTRVSSNNSPVTLAAYQATYRSPSGRQSTVAQTMGPTDLGANSTATLSMAFEHADVGGTVSLSFFSEDFMTEKVVELKTR